MLTGSIKSRFDNLKIRDRIVLGIGAILAVLVLAVSVSLFYVNGIRTDTTRIVDLRVPTAQASAAMVNDINASLAALRGWMLTGNDSFKVTRATVWSDIGKVRGDMDRLSATWTNPANVEKWNEFKTILDEFEIAQQQTEDVANTPEQYPANVILLEEAAPLAGKMLAAITAMIDEEAAAPQTGDEYARKHLLGMMADVRGSFGVGLANIRAYLLSGDAQFKDNFEKLWAKNGKRFEDLKGASGRLTPGQAEQFAMFSELREKFAPLPTKMFEIRGSNKWNMANYTLVTEAAARAGKLLDILSGEKDESGERVGGMVANQKKLLNNDAELLAEEMNSLVILQWVLLFVGLGIGAGVGYLTTRAIVGPITAMTGAMGALAGGDKQIEIPGTKRKDEIGQMAGAVQVFKENMIRNEEMAEEQRQRDEARRVRTEKIEALTATFDKSVAEALGTVASASTELNSTSEAMATTSEETATQAAAVAAAAEQASTNVQTVASAAEELSSSISEISRQVTQATAVAGKAVDEAEKTDVTVRTLSEAANKIGDVVALITDIAEQTNLLALNATIEAARAGDAGKGFAVVANEVKSLANQTAKATDEISEQIKGMQGVTEEAVSAIQRIRSTIDEISQISTTIASAVEEQGAATGEISRNVQQASTGTQEVTDNITGVNQAAGESSKAAADVLNATKELSTQSENLRREVDTFLSGIRAA